MLTPGQSLRPGLKFWARSFIADNHSEAILTVQDFQVLPRTQGFVRHLQYASQAINLSLGPDVIAGDYARIQLFDTELVDSPGGNILNPPGTPSNVQAQPAAFGITVSWSPPATFGGTPVAFYIINVYQAGVFLEDFSAAGDATTFTVIPGLVAGTAYTFTVTAFNAAGQGAESAPSPAVVCVTAGTPSAPNGLAANTATTNQAVLTWTAPSQIGASAISAYQASQPLYPASVTTGPSTLTATFTNMPGGTYAFNVSAFNGDGQGPAASITPTVTGSSTQVNISATNMNSGQSVSVNAFLSFVTLFLSGGQRNFDGATSITITVNFTDGTFTSIATGVPAGDTHDIVLWSTPLGTARDVASVLFQMTPGFTASQTWVFKYGL